MPFYDDIGRPVNNTCKFVAASQSTAQLSGAKDSNPGNSYLERVIITHATTATGTVQLFDGDNSIFLHNIGAFGTVANAAPLVFVYEVNAVSNTTEGFNITTGSSVTACCIGVF